MLFSLLFAQQSRDVSLRFTATICLSSISISASSCLDQILMFWFALRLNSCVSRNVSISDLDSITAKWTRLNHANEMFYWDGSADTQTVDVSSMLLMLCMDPDETRLDAAWQLITAPVACVAYGSRKANHSICKWYVGSWVFVIDDSRCNQRLVRMHEWFTALW